MCPIPLTYSPIRRYLARTMSSALPHVGRTHPTGSWTNGNPGTLESFKSCLFAHSPIHRFTGISYEL